MQSCSCGSTQLFSTRNRRPDPSLPEDKCVCTYECVSCKIMYAREFGHYTTNHQHAPCQCDVCVKPCTDVVCQWSKGKATLDIKIRG